MLRGEKRKERGRLVEGRPQREEVVVFWKKEHLLDNLPRRKDISLPAPIVLHYAKTRNETNPYLVSSCSKALVLINEVIGEMMRCSGILMGC